MDAPDYVGDLAVLTWAGDVMPQSSSAGRGPITSIPTVAPAADARDRRGDQWTIRRGTGVQEHLLHTGQGSPTTGPGHPQGSRRHAELRAATSPTLGSCRSAAPRVRNASD